MSKRIKIPRASIQVGILDDEDFIGLTSGENGYHFFGIFVSIILVARDVEMNPIPYYVIARRIGINQNEIKTVIKAISEACERNGNDSWLIDKGEFVAIRSFSDWNQVETRGGYRKSAGRKPKRNQQYKSKRNQNEIKSESKTGPSVSVTVSDSSVFLEENREDYSLKGIAPQVFSLYESICSMLPQMRNPEGTEIGKKVAKQIRDRTKANGYTLDDWRQLFEYVAANDFLRGGNDRGWVATLDWIVAPANFGKLHNRKYGTAGGATVESVRRDAEAALERIGKI